MLTPDMNHDPPVILVDTREKYPWQFSSPTVIQKLDVGDYSLLGYESQVAIERKSLDDLIGSLSYERTRFERELQRSRDLQCFAVIIEGNWADVFEHRYRSEMSPAAVRESVIAFEVRYQVPFIMAGDRLSAAKLCESYLLRFLQEKAGSAPGKYYTKSKLYDVDEVTTENIA